MEAFFNTFGNQTISPILCGLTFNENESASQAPERLTALRPYLAAGLPLSGGIVALRKINSGGRFREANRSDMLD